MIHQCNRVLEHNITINLVFTWELDDKASEIPVARNIKIFFGQSLIFAYVQLYIPTDI
jgi:hypothetical protein